jgi:hypothetical protein
VSYASFTCLYAFMNDDILRRMELVYGLIMLQCSCMVVII